MCQGMVYFRRFVHIKSKDITHKYHRDKKRNEEEKVLTILKLRLTQFTLQEFYILYNHIIGTLSVFAQN